MTPVFGEIGFGEMGHNQSNTTSQQHVIKNNVLVWSCVHFHCQVKFYSVINNTSVASLLRYKLHLFKWNELCGRRVFELVLLTDMYHFKYQLLHRNIATVDCLHKQINCHNLSRTHCYDWSDTKWSQNVSSLYYTTSWLNMIHHYAKNTVSFWWSKSVTPWLHY